MAMFRKEGINLNLNGVKQLTQQIKSFGWENVGDSIFQWRLVESFENLKANSYSSGIFLLRNGDLKGRLTLTFSIYRELKLSLKVIDLKKDKTTTFNHHQLFACKLKLYSLYQGQIYDRCLRSIDAFNLNADKNEFNFGFLDYYFDTTTITVELFQEALAQIEYRSFYNNTVVGKIEKFGERMEMTDYKSFMFASPRFDFGSYDQLMIVKFKYVNFPYNLPDDAIGLSANLQILSQNDASTTPPFSFTATFSIFSQERGVKDSINKVFFSRDENQSGFNSLLVFYHELEPHLLNDTLYYKVHIEPQPLH